jgi:arylsulfatase A-like enzyme
LDGSEAERESHPWPRLLAVALAAGMLAEAVQMRFLWAAGIPVYRGFLLSLLVIVLLVHLGAVLVLGPWLRQRAWAAAVFVTPVLVPAAFIGYQVAGARGVAILSAAVFVIFAAWSLLPFLGGGAPWVAAVTGGAAGAVIAAYRAESFTGIRMDTPDALRLTATALVACLVAMAAGRLPASLRIPRVPAALALAAVAAVLAVFPARFSDEPSVPDPPPGTVSGPPPAVVIVLDTVRATHLKRYGYGRDTMPNLERFAHEEAVVFERAVSNGAWSPPSHASFLTGLYPPRHGMHYPFLEDPDPPHHYPLDPAAATLAQLLHEAGIWTVAIVSNFSMVEEGGLRKGFDYYLGEADPAFTQIDRSAWNLPVFARSRWADTAAWLNTLPPFDCCDYFSNVSYSRARRITDLALAAVENAGDRSFFLFLNYYDAHQPYRPPYRCIDRFPGRRREMGMREIAPGLWRDVREGRYQLSQAEREHFTALYDGELSCLDEEVARLLDGLRSHPRWHEMLVIVTSDHGEALGEHGSFGHGSTLYDDQIFVPFILKPGRVAPGALAPGARLPGPAMSVDVFPTVLEHVGAAVPEGIDGRAFGLGHERAYAWLYYRKSWDREEAEGRPFQRELYMVEEDGFKLIASTKGTLELYDLRNDPRELENLAEREPERLAALRALLPDRGRLKAPDGAPTEVSPEIERQLRSLGYVE